jgi:hypothetical protein
MRSIKTYIVGAVLALLASSPALAAPGPWVETKTPLVASATYTGPARYLDPLGAGPTSATFFGAHVFADQAGTAYIDISDDAATWNVAASATLTASTASDLTVPIRSAYYRVRVVNGGVDEATLRVFSSQTQSGPGGSATGGGGDASAANQTSQITQETALNTVTGTKADAKSTATDTTAITLMQVQKEISFVVQALNTLVGTPTDNPSTGCPNSTSAGTVMACQKALTAAAQGPVPAGANDMGTVQLWTQPSSWVSGTLTSAMTSTTDTSLIAAPGANLNNYLVSIVCGNAHATVSTGVNIKDGSGGTVIGWIPAAAVYGGTALNFNVPLKQPTANTALYVADDTSGASVKCTATGFKR